MVGYMAVAAATAAVAGSTAPIVAQVAMVGLGEL